MAMQPHQRNILFVLIVLLVLAGAGLVLTSDWGARVTPVATRAPGVAASPVDMSPLQTARALAPLAATPEEQALARDALRLADHEIDLAFAAALYQAASQPPSSDPKVRALQARMEAAQKQVTQGEAEVARLTQQLAAARESEKTTVSRQLELAKARFELSQDELDDAKEDLTRAGGDPESHIQRMVDEHNAAEHAAPGGEPAIAPAGNQAATLTSSGSILAEVSEWNSLRSLLGRLRQAQQDATAAADTLSHRHDDLEQQLGQANTQPAISSAGPQPGNAAPGAAGGTATDAALSQLRQLSGMQKSVAGYDRRVRDEQDLAGIYAQWGALVASRQRRSLHALLLSFTWILLIALGVWLVNRLMEQFFERLAPDQKRLLTLRAVVRITARAAGVILILLVIFGPPGQMATVLALAGAGLTVALKDFIVGFFGWFALMGKNGIRVGDWVEINGVSGEVLEIGLFYTMLLETGNWNVSGQPTGRRVTFINSYAIEGHYFNFSTSGQWLWDEFQVGLPANQDPYPLVEEIQKLVTKETEANARLAEQEWERLGSIRKMNAFSAEPAISVRPGSAGFEILVRYVTRANERYQQRTRLHTAIVELLRHKSIPQPAPLASSAETA
jgi:small-conductance mechanosensitive channel